MNLSVVAFDRISLAALVKATRWGAERTIDMHDQRRQPGRGSLIESSHAHEPKHASIGKDTLVAAHQRAMHLGEAGAACEIAHLTAPTSLAWRPAAGRSQHTFEPAKGSPRTGSIPVRGNSSNGGNANVIRSNARVVHGTPGDDIIIGGSASQKIYGGGGNDIIIGAGGDDRIFGGAGREHIRGGAGRDHVHGGAGNDHIRGGAGNDHIAGDRGNDHIRGDAGADHLAGDIGDDHMFGDGGNDHLAGGMGTDVLRGRGGDDVLSGDEGPDIIDGGKGNDTASFAT
ncbi:MAG: calcium-binding protein, partial [Deltaproteobacteria bacterium]